MTRETSIEAFREFEASGGLTAQQEAIYEIIKRCGEMTQYESYQKLAEESGTPELSLRSSRHSELVDKGYLQEVGFKDNPSGHRAILYAAVENPPLPLEKRSRNNKKNYREMYDALVARLHLILTPDQLQKLREEDLIS